MVAGGRSRGSGRTGGSWDVANDLSDGGASRRCVVGLRRAMVVRVRGRSRRGFPGRVRLVADRAGRRGRPLLRGWGLGHRRLRQQQHLRLVLPVHAVAAGPRPPIPDGVEAPGFRGHRSPGPGRGGFLRTLWLCDPRLWRGQHLQYVGGAVRRRVCAGRFPRIHADVNRHADLLPVCRRSTGSRRSSGRSEHVLVGSMGRLGDGRREPFALGLCTIRGSTRTARGPALWAGRTGDHNPQGPTSEEDSQ
jgi:hypothetical protein